MIHDRHMELEKEKSPERIKIYEELYVNMDYLKRTTTMSSGLLKYWLK